MEALREGGSAFQLFVFPPAPRSLLLTPTSYLSPLLAPRGHEQEMAEWILDERNQSC